MQEKQSGERRPQGYCPRPEGGLLPAPSAWLTSPVPGLTCATGRRTKRRARATAVGPEQPAGSAPWPGGRSQPLRPASRSFPVPALLLPVRPRWRRRCALPGQVSGRWAPRRARRGRAAVAPRPSGRGWRGAPEAPGRAACVTVPTWPSGAHVTCGQAGSRLGSPGQSPPPAPPEARLRRSPPTAAVTAPGARGLARRLPSLSPEGAPSLLPGQTVQPPPPPGSPPGSPPALLRVRPLQSCRNSATVWSL